MNWYEELPDNCPPIDAFEPKGNEFYRLCKGSSAISSDFYSQKKENPSRTFAGVPECLLSSVSIWDDKNKCLHQKKYPTQKNKTVCKIILEKEDGTIKNSFKTNHYSWWRSESFNPALALTVDQ